MKVPSRDPDRANAGFTLIELVVAMMVIVMVLLALVAAQAAALVTTAQTRQRTQATAIANQTMESLRALPWLVLNRGLNSNFVAASGGDANVSSGRLRPAASPTIDEALVTDSSQATDKRPLSGTNGTNLTVSTDPSTPGITFSTRVYVTQPATGTAINLTVITSWTQKQRTLSKSIVVRSQAYAPDGGCGDAANQPFLGACQAIFSADGGMTAPSIAVSPANTDPTLPPVPGTPVLPGSTYGSAVAASAATGSASTSQQSVSVQADAVGGSSTLTPLDPAATVVTTGGARLVNRASNDAASQGAAPPNPANVTATLASTASTITSTASSLTLTPASGASATLRSSMTTSCQTGVPAGEGCASTTVSGGTGSSAELSVGSQAFGLAAFAVPTTSTFSARFIRNVGTTAVGCTVLTGPGCASGGATRTTSGTSAFGTGPWSAGAAPSGLVTITGLGDSVLAQRGLSQPGTALTASRTGTIKYWNGSTYATVTLSPTSSGTFHTSTVTWTSGGLSVQATATVTVAASSSAVQASDPTACLTAACSISGDSGTITVTTNWLVNDGATQYGLAASAFCGTTRATASFKAAPQ